MKTSISVFLLFALLAACASKKTQPSAKAGTGHTRTQQVVLLNNNAYFLTETTDDKSYAFDEKNPVKVGGVADRSGPVNERRYLNALLGPNGEEVTYHRAGSCCHFKTPNGLMDNVGLLDLYKVTWTGSADTLNIYINMYDEGDLKIPVGFTAKKK